jgi:3-oxoadipate enol-lactonase
MNNGISRMGDGCRIAWTIDGHADAPVLILANSLGTRMAMWETQIVPLSHYFRVVRFDMRGHGFSDAPLGAYGLDRLGRDVIELADDLQLGRFAFCGLSLGGMIGQWLGLRAPDRLTHLVIANSSPFMGPPSSWDARIRIVTEKGIEAIAQAVFERWFTSASLADPAKTQGILGDLLATVPSGYAGCCAAIRDMDMRPYLSLIRTKTLVIGGTKDPATPPDHTHALSEAIPHANCVMLEAAHLSNLEQPTAFTAALLDYLRP